MLKVNINKKINDFSICANLELGNEIAVVYGPSGSGKTTILNCISGLIAPNNGEIILNNETLFSSTEGINIKVKNREIGYVFQDYGLFPHMTVLSNIKYGVKNKRDKNINEVLELFNISPLTNRYPHQLSGGEKQRVALIRALLSQPKALLLDEPFSSLDKDIKENLYNEFLKIKINWNIPIVLITHDEYEAKILGDKKYKINEQRLELCNE